MQMEKDKRAEVRKTGIVIESLPSTHFKIKLDEGGKEVLGYLSGKMRLNRIKILTGDKVTVEIGPYDENRGRIVYRGK